MFKVIICKQEIKILQNTFKNNIIDQGQIQDFPQEGGEKVLYGKICAEKPHEKERN